MSKIEHIWVHKRFREMNDFESIKCSLRRSKECMGLFWSKNGQKWFKFENVETSDLCLRFWDFEKRVIRLCFKSK